jgi:S-adenosylmethionine-diacylglycerol 3-amino-3-carboxypropyl transferase
MSLPAWMSKKVFNYVHQHNLVYNACWEDPRLDRQALNFGPDDTVVVITSGGCNALDYALVGPKRIYAVDMNYRQNALLELKLAGIRRLDFDNFFDIFGWGHHPEMREIYNDCLRMELSPKSQHYWDRHTKMFTRRKRRSFYFCGTCGTFARAINFYIDRIVRLRPWINAMLDAPSVEQQRAIYTDHVRDKFWSRPVRFAMGRDAVLSLLGVPRAQRHQIDTQYDGGVVRFVENALETVFSKLPLSDNYFWRVYLTGHYSPTCCPEYLKRENFERLKAGLVDRVTAHTDSVQGFLEKHTGQISRYVLLDHMDWLSGEYFPLLVAEWQAILNRAAPNTRLIWRSGGLRTDFINDVRVQHGGREVGLSEILQYHTELAEDLHRQCRVHTYGSFYIADLTV